MINKFLTAEKINYLLQIYNYMNIDLHERYFHHKQANKINNNITFQWRENATKGIYNVDERNNTYILINNTRDNKRHSANDITEKNAFYFDLDIKENNSHVENKQAKKDLLLNQLKKLPLEPTLINQTENGFHIYFAINDTDRNITNLEWENIENMMCHYIKKNVSDYVDSAATDINRVFKVPYTISYKQDSQNPYLINVVKFKEVKYSIKDLYSAFYIKTETIKTINKPIIKTETKNFIKSNYTNENIEAIKKLNKKFFKNYFKIDKNYISAKHFENVRDMINYMHVSNFIGNEFKSYKVFCSILRKDNDPSAIILHSQKDGTTKYYDFGTKETLDNVQVLCKLANCNSDTIITFFAKVWNIIIDKDEIVQYHIKNANKVINTVMKNKAYASHIKPAMVVYDTLLELWSERVKNAKEKAYAYDVSLECGSNYLSKEIEKRRGKKLTRSAVSKLLKILCNINLIHSCKNFTHVKEGKKDVPNCYRIVSEIGGDGGFLTKETLKKYIDDYKKKAV